MERSLILKLIVRKITVISYHLDYEWIFFQKDWRKIGFFVNVFLNVAAYGKRPIVPHALSRPIIVLIQPSLTQLVSEMLAMGSYFSDFYRHFPSRKSVMQ